MTTAAEAKRHLNRPGTKKEIRYVPNRCHS